MRIAQIKVQNFRGIRSTDIFISKNNVILGDNNTGKTTLLEAIDLALGPDRLNRFPAIEEHDFYRSHYFYDEAQTVIGQQIIDGDFSAISNLFTDENKHTIAVEITLIQPTEEQKTYFNNYFEYWNFDEMKVLDSHEIEFVDNDAIVECLRISFLGHYDRETDDFTAKTYYTKSLLDENTAELQKKGKQLIGFLYLRSLRTGSRALSLERGSLLDIVLRTQEIRPQMWENVITSLSSIDVTKDDAVELADVLNGIQTAINKYVPKEWGTAPELKVTKLTREDLRKVIVAFISTSNGHSAPYYRQGTGTTNMLVLAMLSIIRDHKQNVIFAMEEPETAIPPYAQTQIVNEVCANSDQSIFTSHSPYVIEEFSLNEMCVLSSTDNSELVDHTISIEDPSCYDYNQYFRTQLCEGLLARRIVVCEGATEVAILFGLSNKLHSINPDKFGRLGSLGYCIINSQTDSQIKNHVSALQGLGKEISVFCDSQDPAYQAEIEAIADHTFIHSYSRIEDMIIQESSHTAKTQFCLGKAWPKYVSDKITDPMEDVDKTLKLYFKKTKNRGGIVEFLQTCAETDIPDFLLNMIEQLTLLAAPTQNNADNYQTLDGGE